MTSIIFIHPDGRDQRIEADSSDSAMLAATSHGVDGILAECGGNAMCATCHVYVREDFVDKLPPMMDTEEAVLEVTNAERLPNSRLSCQIKMTEALDGLTVTIPASQR